MTGGYGNKLSFWRYNGDGKNAGSALDIFDNGTVNIGGELKVGDMFTVNKDGHHYVRHTGEHVMHVEGDGNNPFISLGKTGTWDKKKLYIQNVDAHTENPTFRVGIHADRMLMNMNKSHGVYFPRKDGKNTHFDWEDGKNYIRGDTIIDGNIILNGQVTIGTPGSGSEYTLMSGGDGFRIASGGENDSQRWWFKRNPGQRNV
jgi:hypothetical protein